MHANHNTRRKTIEVNPKKLRIMQSPIIHISDLFKCFLKNVPKYTETIEVCYVPTTSLAHVLPLLLLLSVFSNPSPPLPTDDRRKQCVFSVLLVGPWAPNFFYRSLLSKFTSGNNCRGCFKFKLFHFDGRPLTSAISKTSKPINHKGFWDFLLACARVQLNIFSSREKKIAIWSSINDVRDYIFAVFVLTFFLEKHNFGRGKMSKQHHTILKTTFFFFCCFAYNFFLLQTFLFTILGKINKPKTWFFTELCRSRNSQSYFCEFCSFPILNHEHYWRDCMGDASVDDSVLSNGPNSDTNSENSQENPTYSNNIKNKRRCSIFNLDLNSGLNNTDVYLNILKSLIHYGDNIGARCVNCVINENSYETNSLLTQDYDIYQVCV